MQKPLSPSPFVIMAFGRNNAGDLEDKSSGPCPPVYLLSVPGALRVFNIILGIIIFGLWIPGYEHDYISQNQIVNFRDRTKNHGAGYKSETLCQFVMADIIICLLISVTLLIALLVVAHSHVDWNRMNKVAHAGLALFHGAGAICGAVGIWYFEENCCRVDLEWNGVGFRYLPAIHEFGYPRNNYRCNCWLTKRSTAPDSETSSQYSTELWEPERYPEKYVGEESMFVSFAAHHIHLHVAAVMLMLLNTCVYILASYFSKPRTSVEDKETED